MRPQPKSWTADSPADAGTGTAASAGVDVRRRTARPELTGRQLCRCARDGSVFTEALGMTVTLPNGSTFGAGLVRPDGPRKAEGLHARRVVVRRRRRPLLARAATSEPRRARRGRADAVLYAAESHCRCSSARRAWSNTGASCGTATAPGPSARRGRLTIAALSVRYGAARRLEIGPPSPQYATAAQATSRTTGSYVGLPIKRRAEERGLVRKSRF